MKRRRRQKRLEQLEIPTSEVEITDEVLGRGGFGNVYLADLNGLNAAAKVIVFEDDTYEDEDEGEDDFDDADGDGGSDRGRHQHTALKLGTPTTAAAAAAPTGKDRSPLAQSSPPQSRERRQLRRAFMLELEAMKRLKGPHTVAIYGAVTSLPDRLVLVSRLKQASRKRRPTRSRLPHRLQAALPECIGHSALCEVLDMPVLRDEQKIFVQAVYFVSGGRKGSVGIKTFLDGELWRQTCVLYSVHF